MDTVPVTIQGIVYKKLIIFLIRTTYTSVFWFLNLNWIEWPSCWVILLVFQRIYLIGFANNVSKGYIIRLFYALSNSFIFWKEIKEKLEIL